MQHGINVALGHDCIMDPWYPLGSGNMLHVLFMGVHLDQLLSPEELNNSLNLITYNGAKSWPLMDYGIDLGKRANMLITNAEDVIDLLRFMEPPLYVIKEGKVISKDSGKFIFYHGKWEKVFKKPI